MGHVFESPEKEPRRACAEAWGRRNRSRATGPRVTGGPLRLGDELRQDNHTEPGANGCEGFATQACGAR